MPVPNTITELVELFERNIYFYKSGIYNATQVRNEFINHDTQILNRYFLLNNTKILQEKTALQRQIEAANKQIDQLFYQLYGLTEEEIQIVKGGKWIS